MFGRDYSKRSVQELLPLAEKGHRDAQYSLGVAYYDGRGVRKNQQKTVKWWRIAPEHGHHRAQYTLGWMSEKGHRLWFLLNLKILLDLFG